MMRYCSTSYQVYLGIFLIIYFWFFLPSGLCFPRLKTMTHCSTNYHAFCLTKIFRSVFASWFCFPRQFWCATAPQASTNLYFFGGFLFVPSGLCFPRPKVMNYCSTSYHIFEGIFFRSSSPTPPPPSKLSRDWKWRPTFRLIITH